MCSKQQTNSSANSVSQKYRVIRDSKEKMGYWNFSKSKFCSGTITKGLHTGDYTIDGMQDIFSIERKASTGELAGNITEKRFFRELDRLNQLKHAYLLLEFTPEDIDNFPYGSKIPSMYWSQLRINSGFLKKKLKEIEENYPNIEIIFTGDDGQKVAESIFRQMSQLYGK